MGKPGRWALSQLLKPIKQKHKIDFTIANVENAAGGFGLTQPISQKIESYGVDVQTSGNHIWDRQDVFPYMEEPENRVLRPANNPSGSPGYGSYLFKLYDGRRVGVINLEGRVYGRNIDCPFRCADGELRLMRDETKIIVVDFHAETTSEKMAMGYYLDGRASLVVGTHTHVQTADEKILPKGTAYITDAGMTGPHNGVIGMKIRPVLARFLSGVPHRFSVADGDVKLSGVIAEIDDQSGNALSIERLQVDFDGQIPEDYELYRRREQVENGSDSRWEEDG
jgi:metallophosphoesterase (TIGR00282 family)